MKKLLLAVATLLAASSALFAQSLGPTLNVTAPGYSGSKLFESTPGFTISGMGADSSGNVYYIETDGAFTASTKLYKRTAASGYNTAIPLFDYGSVVFGSFVVIQGSKVYFGESSANTIRSANLDGTSPAMIATVVNNYDLAFSGGNAFVSANPDTTFANPQSHVYKFDLGTGVTDSILNATPDFSAGIEFDSTGALLYAVAKSAIGGIYRYSSSSVTGAFGASELTLAPPANRLFANGGNQFLAYDGLNGLWNDDFSTLTRNDLTGLTSQTIGSTPNFIGNLDYEDAQLFATVTDFGTNTSAVFAVTPEPSSAALLGLGALAFFGAWRRRS